MVGKRPLSQEIVLLLSKTKIIVFEYNVLNVKGIYTA
jgi:hypothetical protein